MSGLFKLFGANQDNRERFDDYDADCGFDDPMARPEGKSERWHRLMDEGDYDTVFAELEAEQRQREAEDLELESRRYWDI